MVRVFSPFYSDIFRKTRKCPSPQSGLLPSFPLFNSSSGLCEFNTSLVSDDSLFRVFPFVLDDHLRCHPLFSFPPPPPFFSGYGVLVPSLFFTKLTPPPPISCRHQPFSSSVLRSRLLLFPLFFGGGGGFFLISCRGNEPPFFFPALMAGGLFPSLLFRTTDERSSFLQPIFFPPFLAECRRAFFFFPSTSDVRFASLATTLTYRSRVFL